MLKDAEAKEILGTPEFMRDMIRSWVALPWAPHVDVVDMQRLPSASISRVQDAKGALTQRYGDIAWMVRVRDPTGDASPNTPNAAGPCPAQVLVLVEAQEKALRTMPQRMLEYVTLAMGRRLEREDLVDPIVPVVVYTGIRRWTAPKSTVELIRNPDLVPQDQLPRMRYTLLDLGQLPLPDPENTARQNLATEVVRALTRTPAAELTTVLSRIMIQSAERGESRAADAIAGCLALALARRHRHAPRKIKVDSMEALVSEAEEWNYPPGAGDLQRLL
ncbi:MAG: hypothetical protein EA398_00115, partial [Deltaproteobacteria bacterium]